jgi:hypothetical protein
MDSGLVTMNVTDSVLRSYFFNIPPDLENSKKVKENPPKKFPKCR